MHPRASVGVAFGLNVKRNLRAIRRYQKFVFGMVQPARSVGGSIRCRRRLARRVRPRDGRPACHNESVVYYIKDVPFRPDAVLIQADKIVDGKAVTMGTGQWHYDRAQHTLEWRYAPTALAPQGYRQPD